MPTKGGKRTYPVVTEDDAAACKRVMELFGPKMKFQVAHNCGTATLFGVPKHATVKDWEDFRRFTPTYPGYDRHRRNRPAPVRHHREAAESGRVARGSTVQELGASR
jgi:hypothetical protein